MIDRRREPRVTIEPLLFNKYIDGFPYVAELINISKSGMLIRKIREPDMKRDFYSIELGTASQDKAVWLWAHHVWSDGTYEALHFITGPSDQGQVEELLALSSQIAA